jgi:hypothetical protein
MTLLLLLTWAYACLESSAAGQELPVEQGHWQRLEGQEEFFTGACMSQV